MKITEEAVVSDGSILFQTIHHGEKRSLYFPQNMRMEINNDFFPGQIYFEGRVQFRSDKEEMIIRSLKENLKENSTLSDIGKDAIEDILKFVESDDYIYFAEKLINEYTESSLYLISPGNNRIKVMSVLRSRLALSLSEAKKIVSQGKAHLGSGKKSDLIPLKELLESADATLEFEDVQKPDWPWAQDFKVENYMNK